MNMYADARLNKFCTVCGARMVTDEKSPFDPSTGKRIYKKCPSGLCRHDGVGCNTVPAKGFWAWLAGNHVQCTRCGETYGVYGGGL